MTESVPLRAPMSPPETGASSAAMFFNDAALAISMASAGLDVVISTMIGVGLAELSTPSAWRYTLRTSSG
jgi:hypothetical protein